jgi:hypothetical protein
MDEEIAYCGLICQKCAIYLATREKDHGKRHKMREDIAQEIKEHYGEECKAEDVTDCDGCKSQARLFSGCERCEIRKCAGQKGIENCAHCSEYACERLEGLFAIDAEAKTRLDKIRSGA